MRITAALHKIADASATPPTPAPARAPQPKDTFARETDNSCEIDWLPDPMPAHPGLVKKSFAHVPLFENGITASDVRQGALGNCYFAAAAAAVAHADPSAIASMFRINLDGTYGVRFYTFEKGKTKSVWIKVDADLYGGASPAYGKVGGDVWYAIAEKAYAEFKGSYATIGNGGYSTEIIAALTGREATDHAPKTDDDRWRLITRKLDSGSAITLGTPATDPDGRFGMSEFSNWHAYSIVGYDTDASGERFVYVRNPWGSTKWTNANDGVSRVALSALPYYFGDRIGTTK